jgi:glycosyltransferase involved in cell wall biosynthesis
LNNESVSVLMLAHNHEPYIRQAIEGVLSQQGTTSFQLWVGEDGSSDQTRVICLEMQSANPRQIHVLTSDQPLGMHGNFSSLWENSGGGLVAFCEGDDYWCDTLKLQKQVDFLKHNPDCSLCGTFTDIIKQSESGEWEVSGQVRPPVLQEKYSFAEMIPSYGFHFSSVMLRRDAVRFPDWFQQVYCVDRPLYLLAAQNGLAGLIPEVTSVYRLHSGGAWSTLGACEKAERSIHLFDIMGSYFSPQYGSVFRRTLGGILWSYTGQALQAGDRLAARAVYQKCLRYVPVVHVVKHARSHLGVVMRLICFLFRKRGLKDGCQAGLDMK